MKKLKIAVQDGLSEVATKLKNEGHEVIHFGDGGLHHVDVTIITGVEAEYEEMETQQMMKNGPNECMLIINATNLSTDQVIAAVNKNSDHMVC